MRVRLLVRWGSRLQGDVISVSNERARALEEAGYGKALDPWPVVAEIPVETPECTEEAEKLDQCKKGKQK
jgi:hypothetical protein